MRGDFYTDEWGDTEECLDPAKWHPWESCSGISKAYGNHWMENADPGMVMSEREFVIHFSGIVARGVDTWRACRVESPVCAEVLPNP